MTNSERRPRCLKLVEGRRGKKRQCTSEQVDGSDLCAHHLAQAVEDWRNIVSAPSPGEAERPTIGQSLDDEERRQIMEDFKASSAVAQENAFQIAEVLGISREELTARMQENTQRTREEMERARRELAEDLDRLDQRPPDE